MTVKIITTKINNNNNNSSIIYSPLNSDIRSLIIRDRLEKKKEGRTYSSSISSRQNLANLSNKISNRAKIMTNSNS